MLGEISKKQRIHFADGSIGIDLDARGSFLRRNNSCSRKQQTYGSDQTYGADDEWAHLILLQGLVSFQFQRYLFVAHFRRTFY